MANISLNMTSNRVAALDTYFRNIPRAEFQLLQSGLFKQKSYPLHDVAFEERNGVLTIIPSNAPGSPATQSNILGSKVHHFRMNSHKLNDTIHAADLQGYAGLEADLMLKTENDLMFEKMDVLAKSHDATEERHISSLLQGKILNTDGTVLLDIYKEFGLTRSNYTIDFDLANASIKINDKMNLLMRSMKDNLLGERMTGINVYCTRTFMNSLINNADTRDLLKQSQFATQLMSDFTNGSGLRLPGFANVVFREYYEVIDGVDFFPDSADGFAFAVPTGTGDVFTMYRGPAMRLSTVNRMPTGNGRYTLIRRKEDDTGVSIETESVFLPIVKRPKLLWQLVG
jgi:hypothetical protein